jgi:hypothetical protein
MFPPHPGPMPLVSGPPELTTIAASYAAAMGHHTVLFPGAPGGVPGLDPHCPLLPHSRHHWTTPVTTRHDHGEQPFCTVLIFVCVVWTPMHVSHAELFNGLRWNSALRVSHKVNFSSYGSTINENGIEHWASYSRDSRIWRRVVWSIVINISEGLTFSIFRIEESLFYYEDGGSRFLFATLHGVISQKTLIFINCLNI